MELMTDRSIGTVRSGLRIVWNRYRGEEDYKGGGKKSMGALKKMESWGCK